MILKHFALPEGEAALVATGERTGLVVFRSPGGPIGVEHLIARKPTFTWDDIFREFTEETVRGFFTLSRGDEGSLGNQPSLETGENQ